MTPPTRRVFLADVAPGYVDVIPSGMEPSGRDHFLAAIEDVAAQLDLDVEPIGWHPDAPEMLRLSDADDPAEELSAVRLAAILRAHFDALPFFVV